MLILLVFLIFNQLIRGVLRYSSLEDFALKNNHEESFLSLQNQRKRASPIENW